MIGCQTSLLPEFFAVGISYWKYGKTVLITWMHNLDTLDNLDNLDAYLSLCWDKVKWMFRSKLDCCIVIELLYSYCHWVMHQQFNVKTVKRYKRASGIADIFDLEAIHKGYAKPNWKRDERKLSRYNNYELERIYRHSVRNCIPCWIKHSLRERRESVKIQDFRNWNEQNLRHESIKRSYKIRVLAMIKNKNTYNTG